MTTSAHQGSGLEAATQDEIQERVPVKSVVVKGLSAGILKENPQSLLFLAASYNPLCESFTCPISHHLHGVLQCSVVYASQYCLHSSLMRVMYCIGPVSCGVWIKGPPLSWECKPVFLLAVSYDGTPHAVEARMLARSWLIANLPRLPSPLQPG